MHIPLFGIGGAFRMQPVRQCMLIEGIWCKAARFRTFRVLFFAVNEKMTLVIPGPMW